MEAEERPLSRTFHTVFVCTALVVLVGYPLLLFQEYRKTRDTIAEISFSIGDGEKVLAGIRARKLRPNLAGRIELPSDLQYASTVQGQAVYATRGRNGLTVILFPTRIDRFGLRGYINTSRRLDKSDQVLDHDGQPAIKINTAYQRAAERHGFPIRLVRQVSPKWWYVAGPTSGENE
jgi:hypothetical protein